MALPWVRLDTQFASNPKILELISAKKHRAAFAWVASLGYCGAHGTDGFIPDLALMYVHATKADARDLVEVGLWRQCNGGYEVNGWLEFQASDDEAKARSDKARKAAEARWKKTGI
ncbi:hypothetical protein [Rhodococcus jostii]|uniref:hypothetical protein n=1 Tax=Rhodococcus jostii TaxID=132919 RepID=UPI00362BA532